MILYNHWLFLGWKWRVINSKLQIEGREAYSYYIWYPSSIRPTLALKIRYLIDLYWTVRKVMPKVVCMRNLTKIIYFNILRQCKYCQLIIQVDRCSGRWLVRQLPRLRTCSCVFKTSATLRTVNPSEDRPCDGFYFLCFSYFAYRSAFIAFRSEKKCSACVRGCGQTHT